MSRRAPPPEYYEEESEFEREVHPRSHRRDRDLEEDMAYHRRRSIPLVEEDLERSRLRERPPRRSREELDENVSESEQEVIPMRPRPRRRSHLSREAEEAMILEERERRSSRRPRPREIDEEELIAHDRKPRGSRKHRPREVDEEELVFERERRLPPRRRSREMEEEDLIVEERENRRPPRRRSREVEEELIVDEREHRASRKHRPREIDEEELVLEERDRRGGRRHRPRELDEEELIIDERKRRGGRKHRPPEIEEVEEDLVIDDRDRRRRHRADRDLDEEDMVIHRKGRYPPRPYDSEGDLRLRERRIEDEQDDMYIPPRRRPLHRESDEVMIDERKRDRPRSGKYREGPRSKEELVMQWKDRPAPDELDEDEELHMHKTHRQRRRSHPEPGSMRELPVSWPEPREDDIRIRSRTRPRPRPLESDDEEDIVIHRGKPEQDRRRGSADSEEIILYKENRRSSPRERSPSVEPIHAPPIHQDVFTHHRHIDHGFDQPPRAPSPEASSTRSSFDDLNIRRRSQGNREFDEDPSGDESISPTSRPSVEFHDPWAGDKASVRGKPKSLDGDKELLVAASAHTRSKKRVPREIKIDEALPKYSKRSLVDDSPKDATDEWSVVHTPSKTEALEMTGALDIVEVAPKGSSEPEIEVEEEESQVKPKVKGSKEQRDERWTEITKDLVVREAIEQLGYEFEETRMFYYIFSYLDSTAIDELVEMSDDIRRARRRRIREMQRERSVIPPRPAPLFDAVPPRPQMPFRPRMPASRRMMEQERLLRSRR